MSQLPEVGSTVAARARAMMAAGLPKHLGDLVVLLVGQFATKLIGFVVFALMARRLAPEDYGTVEYVVGLAAFFAMAVDCGLGAIGVRRIGAAPTELPILAAQIPTARLLIALVAAPLLYAGMAWFGPANVPPSLTLLFAASLLLVPWNLEWLLQATGLMRPVAFAQMWRALVFASLVLLMVRSSADLVNVGLAELLSVLAVTVFYVGLQQWKLTPLRLKPEFAGLARLAREGLSVGLANFTWAAAQYLPLFLVGSMIGGADVGWFGAAQRLMLSIATFSLVYHFSLYPALARAAAISNENLTRLLQQSFRVTAWAAIGLALTITIGATPIMQSLFGKSFAEGGPALATMIWVIPVTILSGHSRWALIATGAQVGVLYAQIAGLLSVVGFGIPLVHVFGSNGAAMAAVLASLAVWLVAHTRLLRHVSLTAVRLAYRPAALALIIWAGLQWLPVGPVTGIVAGMIGYVVLAPLIDRQLPGDFFALARSRSKH